MLTQNHIKEPSCQVYVICSKLCREQEPFHNPSAPPGNTLSFGHVGWMCQSVSMFVMAVHLNTKAHPDGAINEWLQLNTYTDELTPLIPPPPRPCPCPIFMIAVHLNTQLQASGAINERLQPHTYTDELIPLICPSHPGAGGWVLLYLVDYQYTTTSCSRYLANTSNRLLLYLESVRY